MILKDETQNLQGINTFSKIHIYSKIRKKSHVPKQLFSFFIKICNKKIQKFIRMKKKIGKKTM
jgi:tryptophan synthase alpha subunit